MIVEIEYQDFKKHLPQIIADVRAAIEKDIFLSYPEGLQKHLCDGEVSEKTYQRVYKLWNDPRCPKRTIGKIKGVYLSELKAAFPKKEF